MKVYIACSSKDLAEHIHDYKLIREVVLKSNHKISGDWLGRLLRRVNQKYDEDTSSTLKEEGIKQLLHSDCLIADVSLPSTSVGYQIAYALSKDIPVLCIYSLDFGQKHTPQIIGVSDISKLTIQAYKKTTLKKTVKNFLGSLPKGLKKFNFIITPEIESFINWGSNKNMISKSEFLREKVGIILKNDPDYLKSLH